ncbi:MAG: GGDEF domain-containing protein [Pseudomonadota bacterium]
MTSDLIQNKYAARSTPSVPKSMRQLELTRDESFLDGTNDIFDILARQSQDNDSWEKSMGTTLSFLERARVMLENAEKKISEQDRRLKTLEDNTGVDPLTGLLNRKGFSKALLREIARTNRGLNEGGLLVMFNLENMGVITNQHGEEAVNTAMRLVGRALESEIRDMDLAARTADDEFVLLFTDTTMSDSLSRLQNMAVRLNRLSLIWNGTEIRVSLSLGLKAYEQGAKPEQIFKDASADLARNKKGPITAQAR